MPCPDDNVLQAYLEDGLEPVEREVVARHLTACPDCRMVAMTSTVPLGPAAAGGRRPHASSPRPQPSRFGRFVVLGGLGKGGMGEVLVAYDPRLDRKVALKIVRHRASDDEHDRLALRQRLAREARAMARLRHPNVVSVYEADEHDDQVFLVMELVEGPTLATWLADKPRPWREILLAFLQAGEGLAAAHEVGIVHRDFKPDNVLIDAGGRVRVTDFGLARIDVDDDRIAASSSDISPLLGSDEVTTHAGTILGTPAFMAPEQAAGRQVDARADIYSWSLALEHALLGDPHAIPAPPPDLPEARLLLESSPARTTGRAAPPRWVLRALARGLATDPAARWPSMRAALTALARDPRARLYRALAGAALIGAVVAVAGVTAVAPGRAEPCQVSATELAGVWDDGVRARVRTAFEATGAPFAGVALVNLARALDHWSERWLEMRREACEATYVRGEQSPDMLDRRSGCLMRRRAEVAAVVKLLAHADSALVARALPAFQSLEPLASCADLAALSVPIPPPRPEHRVAVEAIKLCLDESYAMGVVGRYADAHRVAEQCRARSAGIDYPPLLVEVLFESARTKAWSGDDRAAVSELYQVMWAADAAQLDAMRARTALELAVPLGNRLGRFAEARLVLDLGFAALARSGGSDATKSRLHNARGQCAYKEGKYDEAEAAYRRALELVPTEAGSSAIAIRNNLANVLFRRGRLDDAIDVHRDVLARRLALFGPDHPNVATTRNNLAIAYLALGRYDDARVELERSLASDRVILGDSHPRLVAPLANLGTALVGLDRPHEALDLFARALAIAETRLGPEHADVGAILAERARALLALADVHVARADLDRALTIQNATLGTEHPLLARTYEIRASLALTEQRLADAAVDYATATALEEAGASPDSVTLMPLLLGLGEVHLAAGDPRVALAPLHRAHALPPGGDPAARGLALFALARALAEGGASAARAEIAELVAEARRSLLAAGARAGEHVNALDAWLAFQPGAQDFN